MNKPPLGELVRVNLREYWNSEAQDFTPWLAEHIGVLADALGLGLEVEGTEQAVGQFSTE